MNNQEELKLTTGILELQELGANYWSVPKCGNTSIKFACLRAQGNSFQQDPEDIYVAVHAVGLAPYIEKKRALQNGLLNFTIIRHPVERALSMYRDLAGKRQGKRIDGSAEFKLAWQTFLGSKHSFDRFVDLMCNFRDKDKDWHFRSFYPRLTTGKKKIGPELIICLEDLDMRSGELNAMLNTPIEIPALHQTDRSGQASPAAAQKLAELWVRDFSLWETNKL
ncbi:MAG: sulfotransferase family 2 domain-containing protein [Pseudomonadales bacterium]